MKKIPYRIIATLLVCCIMLSLFPLNVFAVATETVYVKANNGWEDIYCYMWNSESGINNSWPGKKMTKVEDDVYAYPLAADYNCVVFNNGNSGDDNQTENLEFPGDGYIYDLAEGTWSAYSGSKEFENFSYKALNGTYCSITGYEGNNKNVVIPSELDGYLVQSIAQYAFQNLSYVESVTIPEGVETIESSAFSGCTGLTNISLPITVTKIESNAFSNCSGLTSVTLPETLTTIYSYAFSDCTSLESIEIPDSVTDISAGAFYNCTRLSSVKLPVGWKNVLDYYNHSADYYSDSNSNYQSPFVGCTALTEITLPDGMTTVPKQAFRGLISIATVVLPDSIKTIGAYAFYGCTGLNNIKCSENLETIANNAFYNCSGLTSVTFPESLTTIEDSAFSNCSGLTSVTFSEGLTTIGSSAFYNCSGLTSIEIPSGITTINGSVFSGCSGLTSVTLPETLTTIYSYAFSDCTSLESIEIPDSVTDISAGAFYNCTRLSSVKLPVGWKNVLDYYNHSADYYSDSNSNYQSPFVGCTALTEITLPDGMTTVPKQAFRGLISIATVVLPDSIKTIGAYAFYGCTGLNNIKCSENLETIANNAFYNCSGLTSVTFPESLTTIEDSAFSNCSGLTSVTFSEGLTTIGSSAFYNCSGLTSIEIPSGITTINGSVFSGCSGLTSVTLPETLTTIYSYAFSDCTSLESIEIPDSVTDISAGAFYNCTRLSSVKLPLGWKNVLDYYNHSADYYSDSNSNYQSPFVGCTALTEITLPDGMTTVPKQAFRGLTSLETVVLPSSIETIGAYAFYGCSNIEKIWIPQSVGTIGNNTFYNCNSLTIHGVSNSYAEQYANDNDIPFSTEIMVYETSSVSGKVVDENGNGVPDTKVTVVDFNTGKMLGTYITDGDGSWKTSKTIVGSTYVIRYDNPYYSTAETQTVTVKATPNELPELTIKRIVEQYDQTSEDSFTYTALNGTYCTITGYTGTDSTVIIPDKIAGYTVQKIANSAFQNNKTIERIILSKNIETIDSYAFSGCTNLNYVGLDNKLTTIYSYAFSGCTSLESIEIPDSVTDISAGAFYNCTRLSSVKLPLGWKNVLDYYNHSADYYSDSNSNYQSPFVGCTALTEITLPDGMTTVPKQAFRGLISIATVVLPDSIKTIGAYAFYGCTGLNNIKCSENLETIANNAFYNCSGLTSVTFPESLTTIEDSAFSNCSGLTSVTFPESLTTIEDSAFSNCSGLTSVTFSKGLTTIGSSAFYNCSGLTSIEIPSGITTINGSVFSGCSGLTSVTLPETLTTIYSYAFSNCTSLESIEIPDSVTDISAGAFYNCTRLSSVKLPVGWKNVLDYYNHSADYYSDSNSNYQSPFVGCTALTEITLPDGITTVPKQAFRGLISIATVVLPDSIKTIGAYAFYGCTGLNNIKCSENLETIANNAFYNCSGLTSVTFPESLTTIEDSAFSNCSGLTSVTFSEGLTTIGSSAFYNCSGLTSIEIPSGITTINGSVFSGCSGLTSVTLPETLTTIYSYAFSDCTSLESIEIPDSVTDISAGAFYNCTRLSSVKLPVGWKNVLDYYNHSVDYYSDSNSNYQSPFVGCTALTEITLPDGMTTVPKQAFRGLTSLETVVLPSSIETIGAYAFYGCSNIEKIWIPQSVGTIGNNTFYNCNSLTIHGVSNSYAEQYANDNDIPFSTEIMVYETSSVSGKVVDENGNGVPDTKVTVVDFNTGKMLGTYITDGDGSWKTSKTIVGSTYVIRYDNPYYSTAETQTVTVKATPNELPELTIKRIVEQYDQTSEDSFTYTALNGTYCTITGYTGTDSTVIIPDKIAGYTVQKIANSAFQNNKTIERIILSKNIETIDSYAFSGCTNLNYVGLDNKLTTIYSYAFSGCTSLESIEIPDSVTDISAGAFYNCTRLSSVKLPLGWKNVLDYYNHSADYYSDSNSNYQSPFVGCTALTEITLPDGMTTVPKQAFRGLISIATVVLPDSIKTIGAYAFYGCTGLNNIKCSENLETIANNAFYNCSGLTSVTFPESLTTIEDSAFSNCSGLTSVTFSKGLTTIGSSAFYNCSGLTSIEIPSGITTINGSVFSGCSGLTSVTLPETLTTIYSYAFSDCTSLESIEIPDSVTDISAGAFYNCTRLSSVKLPLGWKNVLDYYNHSADYYSDSNSNYQSPFVGCTALTEITLPDGMTTVPKQAFRGLISIATVVLPDSIKTIGAYAFYGCTGLNNIKCSENLETIANNAFYNCSGLTSVTFPESLTTIEDSAFSNCSGLTSVTFSEGLTTIGSSAFYNCSGLTSIEIPSGITTINGSVFSGCSGLTSVTLPETLTTIYSYAFSDCTSLESIEIPDSVTDISAGAFYNCTRLSSVKLPLGWKNVLDYYNHSADYYSDSNSNYQSPFVGCTALTEITLPDGMTTVPKQAFRGLTSLETVVLPSSIETISAYAFYNCSKLSVLDLPDSVKVIGNSAFYGCSGFRMLNFNENLESIGSYAFSGCNGLVSMVLNENLQTLSNYAFSNCANLTAARVPKSVTSFGADSFYNCPKLTIYCYSGSAAHMALENTSYKYFLLDEHEHEYDITVETAATCTRGGSQIKTCKICGYNYIELVDPLGHDYITNVVDPNCTEKGYTIYTCKRCDNKYNGDYVDALGHHYGEWQVRTESTCTEKGVKYRTCSVCSKEEISEISAKGHTYEINVQEPTCIERGYTEHTCSVCGYSYKDKYVNAKGHSYGEWIVDEAATVLSKGSKHCVCTECGHTETQTIAQVIVDINTNKNYGRANFTIVDAQTLEPIKNACIFISTEKDGENTFSTDSNGKVSIVLPVGKQTISVYADGCITRNTKITVKSGINDIPKIGLSEKPTYDAKITSKPMTIEEIKEAGIDTSAPENQHVYKYELKLDFDPEIDTSSIISYFNSEGEYLGGYYAGNSTGSGGSGGGTAEPSDPTYNLHYHVVTGGIWHSWCKSIEVEKGQNVSLTYHPYRDDENYVFDGWYEDDSFTKKIYSTHIKDYSTYVYGRWIYVGEGEEQKISTNPGITIPTKDEVITVYPVSEHFYLIVRGEVKWLKEMFDVEMLVVNNSNTDTLENLTASLTLPKGLSLADMNGEQQTLDKKIDNIPEGKSESVHWYVRGDVAGSYSLEARLKGKIMPFEEDIDDTFVSENQLQVWAGNALNLHFDFPNAAYYGEDYPITITLSNVSDKTLYNINHIVQIEQGMEIYYSDGSKKEKIEKSSWKSIGVREFNPGDKIIIQTSTNIFFKSEIMENKLESLVGIVDGVEQLINAYKAIKTAVDATESLVNCISGCSKALDNFDFTIATESTEKLKLFKTLHQKVSGLMLSYSTSGNKTIDASVKLANTGINTSLNAITDNPDEWLKNNSVDDIKSLLTKIDALENSISESGATSRKFDIYDSIRTAISAIPIRFALSNVIMTEDDNNTTSIPWSYSVSQSSAQYFGVSSVSKYLTSITKATMGEIYDESMPWYLQLIPGLDDPFNQDEAIGYIKATENEIAQFKAKDATGEVTFKAWVECNESIQNISTFASVPLNSASNFVLSSDNKSATVGINGVLTFKGDGMISVKPLTQTGGTLYIEDSEGNLYTYVIDVVAKHECTAGERETVIAPTKDYDGFAVKCCKVCGEIMEIDNLQFENICKNHTYGEWKTETSSTCTQSGIDTRSCSVCGKIEYEFTDKKEHSCNDWKITKAATCQDQGEKQSVCTECGETITRSIEKIPHTDGNWEVVKEATAFEEGLKKLHCKNCDEIIQSSIIPMTKETFGYSKDSQDRILMGIPECITPEMLIKHYDNMGLAVRISDSEGNLPEYVGTGCRVFFDNAEYSVVLKGDTSGDGVIDIFDYYEILDYLNGKGTLTGNYYKASLITSDEPSIFDAYAIIDYINDCGALEQ